MTKQPAAGPFRQIQDADLPQVITLLTESFPRRTRAYWQTGLATLGALPQIPGRPRYGYVIDDNGIRGVLLTYTSLHGSGTPRQVITNISSWCVAPSHRGPLAKGLYNFASRDEGITYTNLSAATHTLKTIVAFGFEPWTTGQAVGIGRGKTPGFGGIVTVADADPDAMSASDLKMLRDHQDLGCIALCVRINGRLVPMIFVRRRIRRFIPCAQLIYCEHVRDFLDHSQAINRHLMRAGYPFLIFDCNGPVPEIKGRYYAGKAAKYTKGPRPVCGVDHTYSEMVYLGF